MKIPLLLNNEKQVIEASPKEKLLTVLRRLNLLSVKCGCMEGGCGACMILLDNKIVPSCIVPVALARDAKIITLEYFSKTEEYTDIAKGFSKAGIHLCGYCNAGKIFTAWSILNNFKRLNRALIVKYVSNLAPCCTDTELLVDGILYSYDYKIARTGVHKDAR
ncbi:MAG: 2Fe-2S iron-sulfur cluster binding domain-containing protein [Treponema sp.]|nr:2Fe-2S iron-sulfur cluster binding domain-containing protein [Treponema sp.]